MRAIAVTLGGVGALMAGVASGCSSVDESGDAISITPSASRLVPQAEQVERPESNGECGGVRGMPRDPSVPIAAVEHQKMVEFVNRNNDPRIVRTILDDGEGEIVNCIEARLQY